ncbi:MAG: succinylglutamate desuccinylase/aspartoacylase family protein [Planctomycetota bacterium]
MPSTFTLRGQQVGLGQKRKIVLTVGQLPTGTVIEFPVFVQRGKADGPTVLFLAGMHGNEINGIEILRRLLHRDLLRVHRGTVLAIPVFNIFGFINFSRELPDGKDPNRSFPGTDTGSLGSRMARMFMDEILPHIDCGVDFHTGGQSIHNFPQIRCTLSNTENRRLASAFGAPFTMDARLRDKSMRKEAQKLGKPILIFEAGETLRLDEFSVSEGIQGTRRLLKSLGMTDDGPAPSSTRFISSDKWIRAKRSGILHIQVGNGSKVEKGQILGTITDPYGEHESPIKSPVAGWVIAINHMPVINQGDALIHLGEATENPLASSGISESDDSSELVR